jgi:hypothetical protein
MRSVLLLVALACLVGAQPALAARGAPRVTGFGFVPSTFAVAPAGSGPVARRATVIRFKLSSRATVRVQVRRLLAGRRSRGRCVKPVAGLRQRRACTRRVAVGRIVRAKRRRGRVAIALSGRLRGRALKPGRYRARIVAVDRRGRRSRAKTARFTVVKSTSQLAPQTPTASPTPSTDPGFPGVSSTGVPAGTVLSAYSGSTTIKAADAVIDGKVLDGEILVDAPGVVIRDSKINGTVHVDDNTGNSLVLEDVEIDCGGANTGVGEANVTVRRANIHGCENGFDMNQNIDVRDSYIHGLALGGHEDGMQFASGHFENGQIVKASRNLTIVHNTIFGTSDEGGFGTSAIISNPGGDTDVLIQDNLMAGGAYTIYCEGGGKGINYRVLDNHFTTRFKSSVGYFGASTECDDETQSGNVIHETGKPIHLG